MVNMTLEGWAVVLFGWLCVAFLIGGVVGRLFRFGSGSDAHIPQRTLEDELDEIRWQFPDRDAT